MLGKTYDSQVCSAARSSRIGGRAVEPADHQECAVPGASRFNDFLTLGVATNILKNRLDGFVDAGIMERRSNPGTPEHFEYVLTAKGRELAPIIVALTEWGDRWAAPDGPPILYVHSTCGGPITLQTSCANCGQVQDPAELRVRPGPGMPADMAERIGGQVPVGTR